MLNVNISKTSPTIWREVDLGDTGSFRVQLKKPTWDQITQDMSRLPGHLEERLKNCLVGWEGVQVNGEDYPFSWENLQTLGTQVPAILHVISAKISDLYFSFGEDEEKNSEEASSDS